jgi:hypothetical protein
MELRERSGRRGVYDEGEGNVAWKEVESGKMAEEEYEIETNEGGGRWERHGRM